jgi:hypothetical protein
MLVFWEIAFNLANCNSEAISLTDECIRMLANRREIFGLATVVRIPMIATTIMSSVRVKPLSHPYVFPPHPATVMSAL